MSDDVGIHHLASELADQLRPTVQAELGAKGLRLSKTAFQERATP